MIKHIKSKKKILNYAGLGDSGQVTEVLQVKERAPRMNRKTTMTNCCKNYGNCYQVTLYRRKKTTLLF